MGKHVHAILIPALVVSIAVILLAGCLPPIDRTRGLTIDHTDVNAGLIPDTYITQIKTLDIYFEHASVGGNIMDGIDAMAAANAARYGIGRPITAYNSGSEPTGAQRSEIMAWFGANNGILDFMRGNPGIQNKIDYFNRTMTTTGFAASVDVAMFKFCWIDDGGTAQDAFDAQRTVMDALEAAYPGTVFIWWTMPVYRDDDGLGSRRAAFNDLVRNYCTANNKILFDLADIERYTTTGTLTTAGGYEALVGAYTGDGGHLNAVGEERVANAFWVLLARISGWQG